jgi:hypothetical protein
MIFTVGGSRTILNFDFQWWFSQVGYHNSKVFFKNIYYILLFLGFFVSFLIIIINDELSKLINDEKDFF